MVDLADDDLLRAMDVLTDHRRHLDALAAWVAGEVARRSSREHGYEGLAQRNGYGSAEALLGSRAPLSRPEARRLVETGTLMATAADARAAERAGNPTAASLSTPGWERAIGDALRGGTVGPQAADAIRRPLAEITDRAPADLLQTAATELLAASRSMSLPELHRAARAARDLLDQAGIADREQQRRAAWYLKRWIRDDGMYAGSFLLDPENGRTVFAALDAVVAPRRGGPRFVDAAEQRRRDELERDDRTDDQLLADALVDMVRLAADADPGRLFGSSRPAVRMHVAADPLGRPDAHGYIEGDGQPVSRATIERSMCDGGVIGVMFDQDGQVVDVGRTKRLFTARQRVALAARDGGCVFPGCDRPPSYCEAHHIVEWKHGGVTDVRDGVLLCRHHHMLVHNNNWSIVRRGAQYLLIPPRSIDPAQTPRLLMPRGSPLLR